MLDVVLGNEPQRESGICLLPTRSFLAAKEADQGLQSSASGWIHHD